MIRNDAIDNKIGIYNANKSFVKVAIPMQNA